MEINEGEIVEFEPDSPDVVDTEDGGAIVTLIEEMEEGFEQGEFYDNLATQIPEGEMDEVATRLLEEIERDKESRSLRDKQYEEAIKRTGLGKEAPGGAEFQGASKVVHPMLTEACVDFSARAIKELMPPNGPARSYVPGDKPDPERTEKAERTTNYMNWQFLKQMPDFRSELEQLLTQLPLGGSQFLRLIWDHKRKRPVPTFWPVDDVYIPYAASNYYTAERVTYRECISDFEFEQRVAAGIYRDIGSLSASMTPEQSESEKATDKIEGKSMDSVSANEDGLRVVFEVMCFCEWSIEDSDPEDDTTPGSPKPYLVTIDENSRKVVSIIRNWEEDDPTEEPMYWAAEFPFVPWRGAYSIGLGQMMGSLSGAATGALRALLDSAHINNLPTLLRLKGSNLSGQTVDLQIAEVTEIEGGVNGDDIRKLIMPVPFNPPNPVLLTLLNTLTDYGKGIVGTTFESFREQQPNMPVGTALAMIEEGMQVMSAIHLRLYQAMNYVLKILFRINKMYLNDEEMKDEVGEILATAKDFEDPMDVVPVSDPNVFSDVQRMAQLQVISERADAKPEIYNLRKIEERILERTKIPNWEELLIPLPEPEPMNAVNENVALTLGRPVAAFPNQDHLAHLQVHLDFLTSPVLGQLPIISSQFIPGVLEHIKEHISMWYVSVVYDTLVQATGVSEEEVNQLMTNEDSEVKTELDQLLAVISQKVIPEASDQLEQIPQIIQEAMQLIQSMQPQPQIPIDPNKQMEIQAKQEMDQRKDQRERAKLTLVAQNDQEDRLADLKKHEDDLQVKFMELSQEDKQSELDRAHEAAQKAQEYVARLEELSIAEGHENNRTAAELASKEEMNAEDNLTALRIAAAEVESGEKVAVTTGTGVNPNPNPSD
jgi:hypothetical protein